MATDAPSTPRVALIGCGRVGQKRLALLPPGSGTVNASLAPLASQAAQAGKHILVEKPGAISLKQLDELESVAGKRGVLVRVGYNHRYHPACLKALEIFH